MIGPGRAAAVNGRGAKQPRRWRWPVVGRPPAGTAGAGGSPPITSWRGASSMTSPRPPCGGGSPKPARPPWVQAPWCLPEANAAVVARMADLRARDEAPDAPPRPRGGFEERPCPWLADSREPPPLPQGHARRVDEEATRHGPCQLFRMAAPFQGGAASDGAPPTDHAGVCPRQGRGGRGPFPPGGAAARGLGEPEPPTPAARCEAFPPAEARRILRNLECHPPPVPGSWGHRKEVRINLKRLSPTYSL
jgi:hypothetical protein